MSFLTDFGVQPILLLAQIVNFLILLFILKKFLYKPILKVLEERKQKIADSLSNAEEIEKRLQKIGDEREDALRKAAKETEDLIAEATQGADKIIKEAHEKAGKDIEKMIAKSEESMRLEREALHQEIRTELAALVVEGLQKVTGKVISKADQKKMVKDSLKELK